MNTNSKLIAPCGMNCGLCYAYLRDKNNCPGCRLLKDDIPISIDNCKIRNCDYIKNKKLNFCFRCEIFPCKDLKHLDKRYRTKYKMSEIDNLLYIKEKGIKKFLLDQDEKWTCSKCGKNICVHKGVCIFCRKI